MKRQVHLRKTTSHDHEPNRGSLRVKFYDSRFDEEAVAVMRVCSVKSTVYNAKIDLCLHIVITSAANKNVERKRVSPAPRFCSLQPRSSHLGPKHRGLSLGRGDVRSVLGY